MRTSNDTGLDGTKISSRTGVREDQMSAASRPIQAAPDLRPLGAAIGTLIVAGAIAFGLATSQAAPATTKALNTAPNADHGWSSEARPLSQSGSTVANRSQSFYQPAGLSSTTSEASGGAGYSRTHNVAR
jgi:hypothetical protein